MTRTLLLLTLAFTSIFAACDHFSDACTAASCPSSISLNFNGITYTESDFNFVSFGDFVMDHGDTEGRTLIRGDLTANNGGVSFGYLLQAEATARYSLIVGGNANWVNGELYPLGTGFFVGGTFTGASTLSAQVNGTCNGNAGCLNSAIDSFKSYYSAVSAAYAAQAETVSKVVVYQTLNITCTTSAAVQFVSVDASVFSTITAYATTNCAESVTFVMNIGGSADVVFAGNTFVTNNVVFNVLGSGKVTANSYVLGSLLAVNSEYHQTAGTVVGKVIVGTASAVVQANLPQCNGTTTSTTAQASTSTSAEATTGSAPATSTSTSGAAPATSTSTSGAAPATSTSTSGAAPVTSTSTSGTPSTPSTSASIPPNNFNGTRPQSCVFLDDQVSCATTAFDVFGKNLRLVDYDVIVFGDLSATSGDIQGRAWVSGAVTLGSGFSFGQYLTNTSSDDWVLVAGSLSFQSGSFSDKRALVAGSVNVPSYLSASIDTPCTNADCLSDLTSSAQACYNQAQSNLAALSSNVAVTAGQVVQLNCNSANNNQNILSISGSDLSNANAFQTSNCKDNSQWIINVVGSDDVTFSGDAFPALSGNIIYNIQGSGRTIAANTGVNGAILAPSNKLTMDGGVIHGKVVVASAQIVQINLVDCPPGTTSSGNTGNSGNGNDAGNTNSAARMGFSVLAIILAIAALF